MTPQLSLAWSRISIAAATLLLALRRGGIAP